MHPIVLTALLCVTPATERMTVGVAPFAAHDGSPQWVGTALSEALSLRVHHQPELNVLTPRQIRAALRQLGLSADQLSHDVAANRLAAQLGADVLLVGTHRVRGERVSISVRTVRAGRSPASTVYVLGDSLDNLIALEARAARAAAVELGAASPQVHPGAFGTENLQAWRSFAEGSALLARQSLSARAADPNAPSSLDAEQLRAARSHFEQATTADPDYGEAWAGLAVIEALEGDTAKAWRALGTATALGAGHNPLSVLAAAFVRMREGRFDEARSILSAAIDRHPGFLHARGSLGHLYAHFGRFREARAVFRKYAEVAPRQPWVRAQVGYANARLRKYDDAIADAKAALAMLPESPYLITELASRYIDAGKLAEARQTLEQALAMNPDSPRTHVRLAYVHLLAGQNDDVVEHSVQALRLAGAPRQRRDRAYAHLNLAHALGRRGEIDEAFVHLDQAREEGLLTFGEIDTDPQLTNLRADPRYAAFEP